MNHLDLARRAAERHGIEPGYWDIFGNRHETSDALRAAILRSLGVVLEAPLAPEPEVDAVYVVTAGGRAGVTVRPGASWGKRIEGTVALELGGEVAFGAARAANKESQTVELPEGLPLGYHRLRLQSGKMDRETSLIVCPERAWMPPALERGERRAGLAVCLWGVHGEHTWGCGDFTALERLIDWVSDHIHGAYIALNPLHAIHNRAPYNTSPYLPNSLHYRNPIYLDVDRVEDAMASPEYRALRQTPEVLAEIASLNGSEFVDYEGVYRLKLRLLRQAFEWFVREHWERDSGRGRRLREFIESDGELLKRYAAHSALDAEMHRRDPDVWVWTQWPVEYQDPESGAVDEFLAQHPREFLFHQYLQWLVDEQVSAAQRHAIAKGMDIGLLHDLPLATDRCGAELWANRPLYVEGCRVGAPPDDFSPNGQDWSFPPPNREAHRANAYRCFADSIRHSARHGGALRIDHVMRLFRLYWIPDGFAASEGTYVRDYHDDLLRVLALESVREQVLIVGEDLGTVEPWMREALARTGILSYRLFYFEKHPDGAFRRPREYPAQALVSSTTHDLPTLSGFWAGRDIDVRFALGLLGDEANRDRVREQRRVEKHRMLDALIGEGFLPGNFSRAAADGPELSGELHNAITGYLASTPSLLLTLNQEDLTKEVDQQNVPATTWEYPNWRRKMRFSVEDLSRDPKAAAFAQMMRHWLDRTGRASVR
ncbi:MAG: 4-alpha-glucanotransferase [Bryobacteraceae bacterium]